MDTPATDYIRHRLQTFDRATDETIRLFGRGESPATGWVGAPYHEKCMIPALLECLAGDPGHAALAGEYARISRKLAEFLEREGPAYRGLLHEELRFQVHACHAEACHTQLGRTGSGRVGDIARRELIDELCRVLHDHYDLSGITALVRMIDENLPAAADSPGGSRDQGVSHEGRAPAESEYPFPEKRTGQVRSE